MDSVNQHEKQMDGLDVLIACYAYSNAGIESKDWELFRIKDVNVNKMKPIILQHLNKFHEDDEIPAKQEFMKFMRYFDKAVEISFSCELMEMSVLTKSKNGKMRSTPIDVDRRFTLTILKEMIREKIPIVAIHSDNVIKKMENVDNNVYIYEDIYEDSDNEEIVYDYEHSDNEENDKE